MAMIIGLAHRNKITVVRGSLSGVGTGVMTFSAGAASVTVNSDTPFEVSLFVNAVSEPSQLAASAMAASSAAWVSDVMPV